MSLDVKERAPAAGKKAKRPPPYKVVLYEPFGVATACHLCVLRDAFNMPVREAFDKMWALQISGSVTVTVEASKDMAETKANKANRIKQEKAESCTPIVGFMNFVAEPEEP